MSEFVLTEKTTFEDIKRIAAEHPDTAVYYGALTCWWVCDIPKLRKSFQYRTGSGLPCDPRGGMLFECADLAGFIRVAEEKPSHYGKHGLRTFMAAFHGNVMTEDMRPTCFESWDEYNDVIDEHDKNRENAR